MRSIAILASTWDKLAQSSLARGRHVIEPQRSPYGHVYLWLDPLTQNSLEAARGPNMSLDEVILKLIEEERQWTATKNSK